MAGHHTRQACPPEYPEGADRRPPGTCLRQGRLRPVSHAWPQRRRPGRRPDMTTDEIDCSEEGGTEPAIALLPRLATAQDA
jgi:hypothetical protein